MSPASYQTAPPRDVGRSDRPSIPTIPLPRLTRAGNGTRTRDPNLGKVVLYQLSYSRGLILRAGRSLASAHHRRNAVKPDRTAIGDRGVEARGIEPLTS
jgi:hypothetical protein